MRPAPVISPEDTTHRIAAAGIALSGVGFLAWALGAPRVPCWLLIAIGLLMAIASTIHYIGMPLLEGAFVVLIALCFATTYVSVLALLPAFIACGWIIRRQLPIANRRWRDLEAAIREQRRQGSQ